MTTFTTRVAMPTDEAGVSDLLAVSYAVLMAPDYAPEVLDVALPLICQANPALLESGTYYVVETPDAQLVGCGGWTPERPGQGTIEPGLGHIRHFATQPDRTRQGIGRTIMDACKTTAQAKGIKRLECYSSLSAVAFYQTQGFAAHKPIDIPITATCRFPSVLMDCVL